jgi:hypothetical protein
VTDRVVGFATCLLALSVLAVPSKAQALPVLLSVQSAQVTFGHDLNDNALVLHSGGFGGNWLALIPWGGGGRSFSPASSSRGGGGGGGISGFAGGFPGSAAGFPGAAGAGGFPGSASAFFGSSGSFPGGGVGPYVTIVTLGWDGPLGNGIGRNSALRHNSTWTGATASTASEASMKVPEPASALLFGAGALVLLRSASRRRRA